MIRDRRIESIAKKGGVDEGAELKFSNSIIHGPNNDISVPALLDTGASVNVMQKKVYEQLQLREYLIPHTYTLSGVAKLETLGELVNVPITLGGKTIHVNFTVRPDDNQTPKVIVGIPTLNKLDLYCKYSSAKVVYQVGKNGPEMRIQDEESKQITILNHSNKYSNLKTSQMADQGLGLVANNQWNRKTDVMMYNITVGEMPGLDGGTKTKPTKDIKALVDTGCQHSAMSEEWMNKLGLAHLLDVTRTYDVVGIGSTKCIGRIYGVPLTFRNPDGKQVTLTLSFDVIQTKFKRYAFLIGAEAFVDYNVTIDVKQGAATWNNRSPKTLYKTGIGSVYSLLRIIDYGFLSWFI